MDKLDPISQTIGALSAQINNFGSQLVDLRGEILTNRSKTEDRWDLLGKQLEELHAEYRNVKHLERNLEQTSVSINVLLKSLEERLRKIEDIILIWRTRAAVLILIGSIIGSALMFFLQAMIKSWTN